MFAYPEEKTKTKKKYSGRKLDISKKERLLKQGKVLRLHPLQQELEKALQNQKNNYIKII